MFSRDAQHTAASGIATPPLNRIIWQMAVDEAPQYVNGQYLLAHYGSPVITAKNSVIVPVKSTADGKFRVEVRSGSNGGVITTLATDYVVPPHNWFPSFNASVTTTGRVYWPGPGGILHYYENVDDTGPRTAELKYAAFYGNNVYTTAANELNATLMISTPVTLDASNNAYFGFFTTAANSVGIRSGVARLAPDLSGTWQAATVLANDVSIDRVAMNSAPALSADGAILYVAVSNAQGNGYLLALDSATLAPVRRVTLMDPKSGALARITGDATTSPVVGPDGDVFYGVLENPAQSNNSRGWLLHFNAALTQTKTPGAFGWDNTPSVIPASAVATYSGPSSYLLVTKYNNYAGSGTGNGQNRMAVLDPSTAQAEAFSGIQTMREVLTILGPTADADHPGGVREWCVNTAAFDPGTRSMLINNEDGNLYRWSFATNQLTERIRFNNGLGQSYTPTAVGADGTVYAINNAVLFAVGK